MTITQQGKDRLLALIRFISELPPEKFDYSIWQRKDDDCGTIACAGGWCPAVFPEFGEMPPSDGTSWGGMIRANWRGDRLGDWFGLDSNLVTSIFVGEATGDIPQVEEDLTPTDWCERTLKILETLTVVP